MPKLWRTCIGLALGICSACTILTNPGMQTGMVVAPAIQWWEGAGGAVLGALFGALIGSCIPLSWARWTRRKERFGEVAAMQEEMLHAHRAMVALRTDNILAPLYHLPLTMFERALPKLIGDGLLRREEVSGLIEYVMRAEELNRGLELARQVAAAGAHEQAIAAQWGRNLSKIRHILDERHDRLDRRTVYVAAKHALIRLGNPRDAGDLFLRE
jgi:uncharacterized protein YacL